jgi:hypothetical protein
MIKFPKISIKKGYLVVFDHKDTPESLKFFYQVGLPATSGIKAFQDMLNLGKRPIEYEISIKREINISITF